MTKFLGLNPWFVSIYHMNYYGAPCGKLSQIIIAPHSTKSWVYWIRQTQLAHDEKDQLREKMKRWIERFLIVLYNRDLPFWMARMFPIFLSTDTIMSGYESTLYKLWNVDKIIKAIWCTLEHYNTGMSWHNIIPVSFMVHPKSSSSSHIINFTSIHHIFFIFVFFFININFWMTYSNLPQRWSPPVT